MPFDERTGAIHAVAAAPGAGELPVDEDRHAAFASRRRQFVFRNDRIGGGGEECDLLWGQDDPGLRRSFGARRRGLGLDVRAEPCNTGGRGRSTRAGNARTLQKIAS